MSEKYKHEVFAEHLNTKFAVADAAEPYEIELIEVTEPTVTDRQTMFSLFFLGRGEAMLPQATYRLEHERLGEIRLFLVPNSRHPDGFKYEAVFNLMNEAK